MDHFSCASCGSTHPTDDARWQCGCGGLLDLILDPDRPAFDSGACAGRPWTLWRYREALPIADGCEVVLGEGCTPMLELDLGPRPALVKQEQLFPSGSYKDRGAAVLISKARELGVSEAVEDSSGNAGAAVAAYSARAGIRCRIFAPASTSPGKLAQIESYGADLVRVPGSREDTAAAVLDAARTTFYASHVWNPYFFQGTKTFAYEVAEQLGWEAPDTVVLPAGNGTLLLGAAIGFRELRQAGITRHEPKLVAIQADHCAPLCAAFEQGRDKPEPVETRETLAEGIAIAEPMRGPQMLDAVRRSGGTFIRVEESEIGQALARTARMGFFIEPTSAAVIAGATRYLITAPRDERVVTAFTGHGLKAADKVLKYSKG